MAGVDLKSRDNVKVLELEQRRSTRWSILRLWRSFNNSSGTLGRTSLVHVPQHGSIAFLEGYRNGPRSLRHAATSTWVVLVQGHGLLLQFR
jgi:hypothetical protein